VSAAERELIGSVLTDTRLYPLARDEVTGDDFEDPRLGLIWDGVGRVLDSGGDVNKVSIIDHLREWDVRGLTFDDIFELPSDTVYAGNAARHARVVRTNSLRRRSLDAVVRARADLNDPGADPETTITKLRSELEVSSTTRDRFMPMSLREVMATKVEHEWVVPGLLEKHERLMVTAAEGVGKTTLMRQMLVLPAAGLHPFTLERIPPVRALAIDAENTQTQWARTTKRIVKLAVEQGQRDPQDSLTVITPGRFDVSEPRTIGAIHRLLDRLKPDLLFIGPLYRIAKGVTKEEDAAGVLAALDEFRDRGVAMLIEAHAGHGLNEDRQRDMRPRGSSAVMGWPEFGLGVIADKEPTGKYFVKPWRGGRERRDWPTEMWRGNADRHEPPFVVRGGPQ
jgi:replicative DNA helicase